MKARAESNVWAILLFLDLASVFLFVAAASSLTIPFDSMFWCANLIGERKDEECGIFHFREQKRLQHHSLHSNSSYRLLRNTVVVLVLFYIDVTQTFSTALVTIQYNWFSLKYTHTHSALVYLYVIIIMSDELHTVAHTRKNNSHGEALHITSISH